VLEDWFCDPGTERQDIGTLEISLNIKRHMKGRQHRAGMVMRRVCLATEACEALKERAVLKIIQWGKDR